MSWKSFAGLLTKPLLWPVFAQHPGAGLTEPLCRLLWPVFAQHPGAGLTEPLCKLLWPVS